MCGMVPKMCGMVPEMCGMVPKMCGMVPKMCGMGPEFFYYVVYILEMINLIQRIIAQIKIHIL